nr:hypothetical protein CFP56_73561 [Quercus suber]
MKLPKAVRQGLYDQLPTAGTGSHDIDNNPLHTAFRPYMEDAIANWQGDLREGRESKKWRQEAIDAGTQRESGKFDEYTVAHKEEWWGECEVDDTREQDGEHLSSEPGPLQSDLIRDTEPDGGRDMSGHDTKRQKTEITTSSALLGDHEIPTHTDQQSTREESVCSDTITVAAAADKSTETS